MILFRTKKHREVVFVCVKGDEDLSLSFIFLVHFVRLCGD